MKIQLKTQSQSNLPSIKNNQIDNNKLILKPIIEKEFDTLCVIATNNSKDIIIDQIEAILWGYQSNVHIVVVDDSKKIKNLPFSNVDVIQPKGKIHTHVKVGFKVNEGIDWALKKYKFKMVSVLDDDALIIRKGLDEWALQIIENNHNIGLLGTKDHEAECTNYIHSRQVKQGIKILSTYWVHLDKIKIPEKFIFYAVNFQPYAAVKKYQELGLLDSITEFWPSPCESYQAIITTMLGFEIMPWGTQPYSLKPPLYSMYHKRKRPEDPRKISKEFLVHHSIKQIEGVSEIEIRRHYKKLRNKKLYV